MVREIVKEPAEILRQKACIVWHSDRANVQDIISDLVETMEEYNAVGIAAPQIGVDKAICIVGNIRPIVLINPQITWKSPETHTAEEGCLSIPETIVKVARHLIIDIKTEDEYGWPWTMTLWGDKARIAQHEIDHLNGILITDY